MSEQPGARDRLLQATGALITERETIEVSLAQIAARAGVNAALVKYYFGAKTGLLEALLRCQAERPLAQMATLLDLRLTAAARMRLHLRGMMRSYRQAPYLNRLMQAMLSGPDRDLARRTHEDFVAPVLAFQRRVLADGVANREFQPVEPMFFYLSAVGACDQFLHSAQVMALTTGCLPSADFSDGYMGFVEDMVMSSLLRPATAAYQEAAE